LIRTSFVARHQALAFGKPVPWQYAVVGVVLMLGVVWALVPPPAAQEPALATPATFAQVQTVLMQRCTLCHGAAVQSKNIRLDSADDIKRHAQEIYQQAVVLKAMPMNNATQITEVERSLIGRWYTAGASSQ
jgi:uncharacterized membrane protein